uniref:Carbonic anhydrase n=1 Tax=Nothoprocta perdicaria TaxID=30464 RepID=A0A8C6ZDS4_NOTPE
MGAPGMPPAVARVLPAFPAAYAPFSPFPFQGLGRDHWTYKGNTSLREWDSRYPDCGGAMQSPININTAETVFSPQLRPIQLAGYSLSSKEMLKLKNNGHTVVLELPELLAIAGGYAQQYKAVQLHLHWGSPSGPGSEHTVDNHRFPAEIHVVHYNTKYDNFKEAMVHPDGLAVLGAFLQTGLTHCPGPRGCSALTLVLPLADEEVFVPGFNIAGLLPANLNLYFQYNGSLTTPACYQTVKWTVFNQTVQLSQDQISLLVTTLRGDDDSPLQNNFRGVQKLHGRHVLASFQTALPSVQQLPPGKESTEVGQALPVGCRYREVQIKMCSKKKKRKTGCKASSTSAIPRPGLGERKRCQTQLASRHREPRAPFQTCKESRSLPAPGKVPEQAARGPSSLRAVFLLFV